MSTTAVYSRGLPRLVMTGPLSAEGWRATANVVVSSVIGLTSMVTVIVGLALSFAFSFTVVVGAILLGILLAISTMFSALQRSRIAAFVDVDIPAPPRLVAEGGWWRQLGLDVRQQSTWRQLGYHLLSGILSTVAATVVVTAWSAGLLLSTALLHSWFWDRGPIFGWDVSTPLAILTSTLVGFGLLLAAPWVARVAQGLDFLIARPLLGATQAELLSARVASLSHDRAGVVDAAESERRRIERDLHDGTQQRLTSLAMNLGMAKASLTDLPEPARVAIEEAHDEAKLALVELRAFVRGLHPPVLDDRGLDAALSGLVARSPVPARLDVDLFKRPAPTIEAVAYFVVAEALTNVAKHADATFVEVVVTRDAEWMSLRITDDGHGGADADLGTGLRGLKQRVAAVDGHILIDSPLGGPTHVLVELPCES